MLVFVKNSHHSSVTSLYPPILYLKRDTCQHCHLSLVWPSHHLQTNAPALWQSGGVRCGSWGPSPQLHYITYLCQPSPCRGSFLTHDKLPNVIRSIHCWKDTSSPTCLSVSNVAFCKQEQNVLLWSLWLMFILYLFGSSSDSWPGVKATPLSTL